MSVSTEYQTYEEATEAMRTLVALGEHDVRFSVRQEGERWIYSVEQHPSPELGG